MGRVPVVIENSVTSKRRSPREPPPGAVKSVSIGRRSPRSRGEPEAFQGGLDGPFERRGRRLGGVPDQIQCIGSSGEAQRHLWGGARGPPLESGRDTAPGGREPVARSG